MEEGGTAADTGGHHHNHKHQKKDAGKLDKLEELK